MTPHQFISTTLPPSSPLGLYGGGGGPHGAGVPSPLRSSGGRPRASVYLCGRPGGASRMPLLMPVKQECIGDVTPIVLGGALDMDTSDAVMRTSSQSGALCGIYREPSASKNTNFSPISAYTRCIYIYIYIYICIYIMV